MENKPQRDYLSIEIHKYFLNDKTINISTKEIDEKILNLVQQFTNQIDVILEEHYNLIPNQSSYWCKYKKDY